jgi:hypothetical protein
MARLLPYLTTNNTMGVSSGTGTAYQVLLCVLVAFVFLFFLVFFIVFSALCIFVLCLVSNVACDSGLVNRHCSFGFLYVYVVYLEHELHGKCMLPHMS